jgi:hypothetical protein
MSYYKCKRLTLDLKNLKYSGTFASNNIRPLHWFSSSVNFDDPKTIKANPLVLNGLISKKEFLLAEIIHQVKSGEFHLSNSVEPNIRYALLMIQPLVDNFEKEASKVSTRLYTGLEFYSEMSEFLYNGVSTNLSAFLEITKSFEKYFNQPDISGKYQINFGGVRFVRQSENSVSSTVGEHGKEFYSYKDAFCQFAELSKNYPNKRISIIDINDNNKIINKSADLESVLERERA